MLFFSQVNRDFRDFPTLFLNSLLGCTGNKQSLELLRAKSCSVFDLASNMHNRVEAAERPRIPRKTFPSMNEFLL